MKKRKHNNEETPRDALKVTSMIDKALVRSPSKYEQEKKYSLVDDTHTLWTCYKATMVKYDCVHCLCSDCFTKTNVNKKSLQKRGQRNKRKSKDDDPDKCMHNSLTPFTDNSFFTEKYKEKITKEGLYLPVQCAKCRKPLVDKFPAHK